MKCIWMVSVLFWAIFSEGRRDSRPDLVNVGAIFTMDSINGRVSKIAIEAAVKDVNSDKKFLGGTKLLVTFHDSNYSSFLGIIGALGYMGSDTMAIIGPQSSVMAHLLSHIANELHIPMLSFTALDPTFSSLQYPFFVQTAPTDLFQLTAVADLVTHFGWSQVVALYTDEDQSRNGVAVLADMLFELRCKVALKAALRPNPNRPDILTRLEAVRATGVRVIVLHTFATTGLLVLHMAREIGMMGDGYVWIASTWLSTVLDSVPALTPSVRESTLGALTLRPRVPDSEMKRAFVARWDRLSNGSIGLNPYGFYAYDTVWILARALKKLLDEEDDSNDISFSRSKSLGLNLGSLSKFNGGKKLLKNILDTRAKGLTGQLGFDSKDRSVSTPSYDIINVIGNGHNKKIGYWSKQYGLSLASQEMLNGSTKPKSGGVVWPGWSRIKPRGWAFPKNRKELRIGVPNRVSFKDFVSQVNGTDVVKGFCIDVFLAALKLLPYPVPFRFFLFGDGLKNPSYTELVGKVASGELDAVVGDIMIVTNRTKMADFTQPYIESGLVVVTPVKKMNSIAWAFLRPFSPLTWTVIAGFFLFVGTVVWILEHRVNDDFRGPPRKQLITIIWFSFSTMFFAHRENTMTTLGKMVLLVWLFVVLILTSSYTASLTSILTVRQLSSPITGIESLVTSNDPIGFQVGSFAENYLIEELNIPKWRLVALGSPQEYARALRSGFVAAVIDERPYIELFLSDHCMFAIRGQEFTKSGWGFGFRKDSPLAIDMSTAILTLSENGDLQTIHKKWLSKKACHSYNSVEESDELHLESFWGLYVICGFVCFTALTIYFCKNICQFRKHFPNKPSDPSTRGGSRSRRVLHFFDFIDKKQEESSRNLKRKRDDMSSCRNSGNATEDESRKYRT